MLVKNFMVLEEIGCFLIVYFIKRVLDVLDQGEVGEFLRLIGPNDD